MGCSLSVLLALYEENLPSLVDYRNKDFDAFFILSLKELLK